jgi:flagellar motor protein MotB
MARSGRFNFSHWSGPIAIELEPGAQNEAQRAESLRVLSVLLFDAEANERAASRLIQEVHRQLGGPLGRGALGSVTSLRADLERAVTSGQLSLRTPPSRRIRVEGSGETFVPAPAPAPDQAPTFFEARFVDEIGEGISGLDVVLVVGGTRHPATTDGGGAVRFDGIIGSFATLRVVSPDALREIVEPRWQQLRTGEFPTQEPQSRFTLGQSLSSIGLTREVEQLIVLTPELGRIFLELFDKTGRFRHANVKYSISGPMTFEGVTDERGLLVHDDVLPGNYRLKFSLEFFEGKDAVKDDYETPIVVLAGGAGAPQVRMLGAVPRVVMSVLGGLLFETNKNFLLPNALPALAELIRTYEDSPQSKLLVVGHTDTTSEPSYNDPLSVERADSVKSFLADDVEYWLGRYESAVPEQKRWGEREDLFMLHTLPDFDSSSDEDEVTAFQTSRGLEVDGIAGPKTRRQLITEYMAADGTTLPETIEVTVHGCGENFPVDDTGASLDAAPEASKEDLLDRRVELFFFDPEFGVMPKPPGKNSKASDTQYPAWRDAAERESKRVGESKRASQIHAQLLTEDGRDLLVDATVEIELPDRKLSVVSSENGIVFVSAVPAGDFATRVISADGQSEGACKLLSNNLREPPRQVSVLGLPSIATPLDSDQIEIRVLNEDGSPAAGVHYELILANDERRGGVTDDDGFILDSELSSDEVKLVLSSPDAGELSGGTSPPSGGSADDGEAEGEV